MEDLLAQLREVYLGGQAIINEYKQKLAFVIEEKKRLDDLRASLDEQHHSMEAREFECKKVENAVKLHKDATSLMESANIRIQTAAQAEKDLNIRTQKEHADLDNKRELTRREVAAQEKQKKAIEDEVSKRVREVLKTAGR